MYAHKCMHIHTYSIFWIYAHIAYSFSNKSMAWWSVVCTFNVTISLFFSTKQRIGKFPETGKRKKEAYYGHHHF